ncbi:MAG: dTDP-4-dehydrorhamnose 3,5-epimerase [Sphingomonadaceae bacterium]|uniref:dTDP-4-dehydrorhamnose 3,5-epimerase n=1 Tax=Thermaurantiacus sp. TaxID=2820283 RepID=UPI00298F2820|nr:dTDP-4-dehydrorhamnose 3,5-epimerase [Thermaurantiacus sp.]MCS6986103.1 dTDP-4-dehydrorhamnose 3,5-epimerase [Sphingomonadaceae bacterium]MDW8414681.1 dTDP-4-dehydrorhamnose 3,5-epimerase [Thermaurantiacus sp.]
MIVEPLAIPDVKRLRPVVHGDARGFFLETFRADVFAAAGLPTEWAQDNHSRSTRGVLRGLHYQLVHPQGKLVRVARGRVFDVAVDLRRSSPTFGRWVGVELTDATLEMLWIPPGFAHGFLVLSDVADFLYKCTTPWDRASDRALRWDDPEVGIRWPLQGQAPTLSPRDAAAPGLKAAELFP